MGNGLYTQTQKSCFINYVTTTKWSTVLQEKTRNKKFSELRLSDFQDILSEKKELQEYATFCLREKDKEANKLVSAHKNNNNTIWISKN